MLCYFCNLTITIFLHVIPSQALEIDYTAYCCLLNKKRNLQPLAAVFNLKVSLVLTHILFKRI